MRKALVLSFAAHAALFAAVGPLGQTYAKAALAPPEDRWTGTTAELPSSGSGASAGPLLDVDVERQPSSPAPVPAPVPVPAPAVAAPAPRPKPAVHRAKPRPPATGNTAEASDRPRRRTKKARPAASSSGGAGSSLGPASHGSFGSAGKPSVRDLGRAITRAIPPACDADPVWSTLPLGSAGKLEIVVQIDASGHITSAEPRGAAQPKALVNVLRRTMPLLMAGTFAVREGATTEGREILELSAIVSDASEGEGAPDQLAFEYARGRGKARFAQSSGRRVEVSVRVIRIEATP